MSVYEKTEVMSVIVNYKSGEDFCPARPKLSRREGQSPLPPRL